MGRQDLPGSTAGCAGIESMAGCAGIESLAGCAGIESMAGCAGIGCADRMAGCAGIKAWPAAPAGGLNGRLRRHCYQVDIATQHDRQLLPANFTNTIVSIN